MHPATFKTLTEAMGLTDEALAAKLDVSSRNIRRWKTEAGVIPDGVADEITEMWDEWTGTLGEVLDGMEEIAEENGDPQAIQLSRPRGSTGDDMQKTAKIQALAIVLGTQGFDVQVDYEEA